MFDKDGQILINERLGDDAHTGHWEFPGGKLEEGETPEHALLRECQEELGITVIKCTPLITFTHSYPSKTVRLHSFIVDNYENEPRSLEGQPLRWVKVSELNAQNLLPADVAIVKALLLPDHCFVTPESSNDDLIWNIQESVNTFFEDKDALMLVIRQHQLSSEEYIHFVCQLLLSLQKCQASNRKFHVQANTDIDTYKKILLTNKTSFNIGLHLTANRLKQFKSNQLTKTRDVLFGASVHTESEIDFAISNDVDYLILGMIKPSATHPDRSAIQWSGFSSLSRDKAIPIFAIGGLDENDIKTAKKYGARGIAGIRMFLKYD